MEAPVDSRDEVREAVEELQLILNALNLDYRPGAQILDVPQPVLRQNSKFFGLVQSLSELVFA